jgi:hypothetical protein
LIEESDISLIENLFEKTADDDFVVCGHRHLLCMSRFCLHIGSRCDFVSLAALAIAPQGM